MDNGQLTMDNGKLTMENGKLTMDNGKLTMENGNRYEDFKMPKRMLVNTFPIA